MKNYHNPQCPEGINTSTEHPIRTFIKLFVGMFIILVGIAWALGQTGSWLASLIPFEQEVKITERYFEEQAQANNTTAKDKANLPTHTTEQTDIQRYLQTLINRLEKNMQLPEGMHIKVHYQSENVENAFATLGGHIFMYKGLLRKLPNENSLAMLLAHEMAHVKLRHPIRSTAQALAISTGIKYLLGFSNIDLLGNAGLYTQLHFSRSMETAADTEGLKAVYKTYGTVSGATDLFKALQQSRVASGEHDESPFFSTHPLDQQRINKLEAQTQEQNWTMQLPTTSLPEGFSKWL